ncbi:MAG: hypothetical protein DI571_09055 [Arsenicicoccus sp.]|nr:MAG: hypothetical protein DI571_09055 [Arsenicicoccus sp.]
MTCWISATTSTGESEPSAYPAARAAASRGIGAHLPRGRRGRGESPSSAGAPVCVVPAVAAASPRSDGKVRKKIRRPPIRSRGRSRIAVASPGTHKGDIACRCATVACCGSDQKDDVSMKISRKFLAAPAAGAAVLLMAAGPALAAGHTEGMADLQPVPVNDAPGSGSAMITLDGTTLDFTLAYQGLLADAPHAAHIHYAGDAANMCPTAEDDADGDGFLTTTEGAPSYGGIKVSLTTEGDTTPDSGLAVDRFGVGDDVSYSRGGVEVDQETADALADGEAVVVVHGVDHDGSGAYDEGERGASDLDPSLPGEATDGPVWCRRGLPDG